MCVAQVPLETSHFQVAFELAEWSTSHYLMLRLSVTVAHLQTHRRCSAVLLLQPPDTTGHMAQARYMANMCVAAADGRRP